MARPTPCTTDELREAAARLSAWQVDPGGLHRELTFDDFVSAFGFMTSVALEAEKRNHHPEWHNVWNRVVIDLVTHDAGAVTTLDLDLAQRIDVLADRFGGA